MLSFLSRGPARPKPAEPELIFLHWAAFAGLALFAATLLWHFGVWHLLLNADPTFLTLVIMLIFAGAMLWCGWRSYTLAWQQRSLRHFTQLLRTQPDRAHQWLRAPAAANDWVHDYFNRLLRKGQLHWRENGQLTDLLGELAHGPHETAWWVNGIQLKLGLLGKVIGFSVLALQISSLENFDASQSQVLLKNLTGGLGIALLTTMTGLVGNILLGLQLTRLDREADALVSGALGLAESEFSVLFESQ